MGLRKPLNADWRQGNFTRLRRFQWWAWMFLTNGSGTCAPFGHDSRAQVGNKPDRYRSYAARSDKGFPGSLLPVARLPAVDSAKYGRERYLQLAAQF